MHYVLRIGDDECAGISDDEDDYKCSRCVFKVDTRRAKQQIKF